MRPRPPECTDALLALLRAKRLLDDKAISRLGAAWDGTDAPGPHLDELVVAGLLSSFQAEHLREGRTGRLRLGPYRLVERLGRAVYRAEHTLLGRTVVVKVLRRRKSHHAPSLGVGSASLGPNPLTPFPEGKGGPEVPQPSPLPSQERGAGGMRSALRSRREILAAGTLEHLHLVAAHDARWIRGRLVLVLEFIEGIDVSRLLSQIGPLPLDLACRIVRQTTSALDYLHRRGLVHRDVKPANLLLSHDADGAAFVKLLDLGLICPTGTGGEELCGTPDYMPPERGHSPDAIDIRGDLYSLGCTFYELLTGRAPFSGGTWPDKLLRHRLEVPTPVAELRPEVPPALTDIVARLMARDPEDRPDSPASVLELLDGVWGQSQRRPLPPNPPPLKGEGGAGGMSEGVESSIGRSGSPSPLEEGAGGWGRSDADLAFRRGGAACLKAWPHLLAAVVGIVVGCLVKVLPSPPEPVRAPLSLVVAGLPTSTLDLVAVVASAPDGAVIEIPDGEYQIPPIRVEGRSLTLRAMPGEKPRLRAVADSRRWDALLSSDKDLTLEGLDLAGEETKLAPVVLVEGGRLRLVDCKVTQRGSSPAVLVRKGERVEIIRTEIWAMEQGVAVELGAKRCPVRLDQARLEIRDPIGPALFLWCPEIETGAQAEVTLRDCDIQTGRVVACRCVRRGVRLETKRNKLTFRQALVSFDGYGRRDDWRRLLHYEGRENRHDAAGAWLRLEGRPVNVWSEQAWAKLWSETQAGTSSHAEITPVERDSSLQSGIRR